MSTRTVVVLLLALVCGVSAAVGVVLLRARSGRSLDAGEMMPVVTAATDLKRGQVLEAAMLKLASYRKQDVPNGALATIEEAVGRTVIIPLAAREPIETLKLANKGAGRGLAALIPDGMRAFTIQTPHVACDVGGLIVPGNHVDVLLTAAQSGNDDTTGGGMTTTLLQNVQVLAVSKLLEAPEDSKPVLNDLKSVTLLVTPDQAARLDLGMNKGLLHLALRNALDDRDAATRPATMNDLRFHQDRPLNVAHRSEASKPPVEPTRFLEIRTLRGLDAGRVLITIAARPDCPTSGIIAGPADKAAEDQPPCSPELRAEDDKGRVAVSKSEVP